MTVGRGAVFKTNDSNKTPTPMGVHVAEQLSKNVNGHSRAVIQKREPTAIAASIRKVFGRFHPGAVPPWRCSTLALFHPGAVPPWRCSTLALLHPGAAPPWRCSTLALLHPGAAPPWRCSPLALLPPGAAPPWRCSVRSRAAVAKRPSDVWFRRAAVFVHRPKSAVTRSTRPSPSVGTARRQSELRKRRWRRLGPRPEIAY